MQPYQIGSEGSFRGATGRTGRPRTAVPRGLASMRNPSLSNIRIEARFSGSTDNPAEKFFQFHEFALAHPHCH